MMNTDLIKRLRDYPLANNCCDEAADRIATLTEQVAELKRLLRMARSVFRDDTNSDITWENDKTSSLRTERQRLQEKTDE